MPPRDIARRHLDPQPQTLSWMLRGPLSFDAEKTVRAREARYRVRRPRQTTGSSITRTGAASSAQR